MPRSSRICRSRSRPTVTGPPARQAKQSASSRRLHQVNSGPGLSGPVAAAATMTSMPASPIRPGTASRPLRVQRRHPLGVKRADHDPHRILTGRDQPRGRRHQRPRRRRHDDHRPAHPDRPVLTPPHDLQQPLPLLITQPPRPHPAQPYRPLRPTHHMTECGTNHHGMSAQPVNVRGQRTSRAYSAGRISNREGTRWSHLPWSAPACGARAGRSAPGLVRGINPGSHPGADALARARAAR